MASVILLKGKLFRSVNNTENTTNSNANNQNSLNYEFLFMKFLSLRMSQSLLILP